jgi:hypothetical protein
VWPRHDLGLFWTMSHAGGIRLRCKRLGHAPFCFSVTLYGPDGRHDPEVLECSADYRPFIPLLTSILTPDGVDLTTRDPLGILEYPVASADIPQSYLAIKVYGVRDHFRRTLVSRLR